jgi:hypothetical protein
MKENIIRFLFVMLLLSLTFIDKVISSEDLSFNDNEESGVKANANNSNKETICGGFIEIDANQKNNLKEEINLSNIVVKVLTKDMIIKEETTVAQSGYYFLPIYDNASFILKIFAPNNMKFEPEFYTFNIDEDTKLEEFCSDDINFLFKGYSVKGQISTFGSAEGPEGVGLSLYKSQDNKVEKIQDILTVSLGEFIFNPVYPGKYILKPTNQNDIERFDPNHKTLEFFVKSNQNNYLEKALIIKGFNVQGSVYSDNQPIEGVYSAIYSFDLGLVNAYQCNQEYKQILEKNTDLLKKDKNMHIFCIVRSNSKGEFLHSNIPFGKFRVSLFYSDESVSYEISPGFVDVEVKHKDEILKKQFEIISFSVKGKVVNSLKNGIENVKIKIDGIEKSITNAKGEYILKNLVTNQYDLEAQIENMFFDPIQNLKLSPKKNSIPDFIVREYNLCGKINIESTENFSNKKRTVLLKEKETNVERRTITGLEGKFCFEVKPSTYFIHPILTQEEKDAELHLNPDSIDVEIIDKPRLDIDFFQSKVEISGFISCLEDCPSGMKVYLTSVKKNDKVIHTDIEPINDKNKSGKKYKFSFPKILSGQYKMTIQKYEWCWEKDEFVIKVQNKNISNIEFKQEGYSLFYDSHYDMEIDWKNVKDEKLKGKSLLKKSESKICLPHQGEYLISPISCYKFEKNSFIYDTEKKERLDLKPIEYLVKGQISVEQSELTSEDLKNSLFEINVEELKGDSIIGYKKIESISVTNGKNIEFEFYTKNKSTFIVTPKISSNKNSKTNLENKLPKLLFYPKFKQIKIENKCLEDNNMLKFEVRTGIIIKGTITPIMSGVKINALKKDNNESIAAAESLEDGSYTIGPLYKEFDYKLTALKDGYKITNTQDHPYDFTAEKLSFLRVTIVDTNNKPLPGVFLSLSSSNKGFKINNNTNNDGYFDFLELYSGEYYIKPLLKEYKFEPSQKMIKIVGGEHYKEVIIAHRVAFSIFGKVNNLTKEKVDGISIQAINLETNQIYETILEKNMEYRLRGLTPDQKYTIKMKIPNNSCK